jgi:phage terminase small subunit
MALTPKQQRFVEEYLVDLNATQAAIRAGYSKRSAEVEGCRLLKNAKVSAEIDAALQARSDRTQITADRVLTELGKIGFSDIRKAVRWQPNVTGMVEDPDTGEARMAITNEVALVGSDVIDDDTAAAIAEVSQTAQGGLKVKLHDKRAALVDIGRHLGMFKDKIEHSGPNGGPIVTKATHELTDEELAAIAAGGGAGAAPAKAGKG